jgi:hypothetical protein
MILDGNVARAAVGVRRDHAVQPWGDRIGATGSYSWARWTRYEAEQRPAGLFPGGVAPSDLILRLWPLADLLHIGVDRPADEEVDVASGGADNVVAFEG